MITESVYYVFSTLNQYTMNKIFILIVVIYIIVLRSSIFKINV